MEGATVEYSLTQRQHGVFPFLQMHESLLRSTETLYSRKLIVFPVVTTFLLYDDGYNYFDAFCVRGSELIETIISNRYTQRDPRRSSQACRPGEP